MSIFNYKPRNWVLLTTILGARISSLKRESLGLMLPLINVLPIGSSMIATDVAATFFVPIKITMLVAFVLALPYVIYQAWMFVSPGLYQG